MYLVAKTNLSLSFAINSPIYFSLVPSVYLLAVSIIQNKTYHEIAKIARISLRDIKSIIDKAVNEKERMEHKSTAVQAYELFFKGKTLLEVTSDLNFR